MVEPENGAAERPGPAAQTPDTRPFLHRPVAVVTLISGVVVTTSTVIGLILNLAGDDDRADQERGEANEQAEEVQEFEGVAGHFEQSHAILNFLGQHDGDVVYLDVGFPDILGPVSGDNVLVETIENGDGTTSTNIQELDLMTECTTPDATTRANPTASDGCQGVALRMSGTQNDDAQTFFEHGVPRIKGYFLVDDTGGLQNGLHPVGLQALTFDEARDR